MLGVSDLPALFADWGDTAAFNGTTVACAFDEPMEIVVADAGFGGIESAQPCIRVPFNAWNPMPEEDDAITVNGTNYTVAKRTALGDGAVMQLSLKAAS